MNFLKRFILIAAVLSACVGCDQATKSVAKSVLSETNTQSYFGDTVRLQVAYNDGAFLNLGSSLPKTWRLRIFSIGVGALLLGILAYAFLCTPGHLTEVLALGLLFAGGIGNLVDRIVHDGLVLDFINIGIGPIRTGIFNVADIAITVGVLILCAAASGAQFRPVGCGKRSAPH
jgi:signal peptidase II